MRFMPLIFILLAVVHPAPAQGPALPAGTRFIMSHFKYTGTEETEKLYISVSPDGAQWTPLNAGNPVWQPPNWEPYFNVVRDPSIVFANGHFWVAYTAGNYGYRGSFGLLKSTDLINWTFVTDVNTLLPTAFDPFTWGPFFFKDTDGTVRVFVSIGEKTDPATGQPIFKLRTYEVHPLNSEFTQWSAPVMVQAPSDFINEFWVWREGDIYHAVYVDFRQNGQYVHVTSTSLLTGWGNPQLVGLPGLEGAFVLKNPGGGYRVYVEGAPTYGYRYFDFSSVFTARKPAVYVASPITMRNGKVITAAATTSFAEWQDAELAGLPESDRAALADPDRDGIANVAECALGLAPQFSNATPLAQWRDSDGSIRLQHTRVRAMFDVTAALESSLSLNWSAPVPGLSLRSVTMMSDGRELLEWSTVPANPDELHAFRLNATLQP